MPANTIGNPALACYPSGPPDKLSRNPEARRSCGRGGVQSMLIGMRFDGQLFGKAVDASQNGGVEGNGVAVPLTSSGGSGGCHVDADQPPLRVDKRPTAESRLDQGGVLDQILVAPCSGGVQLILESCSRPENSAGPHLSLMAERAMANGCDSLAAADCSGRARRCRAAETLDQQEGEVQLRVYCSTRDAVLRSIRGHNDDLLSLIDHMGICQNQSRLPDNDTGPTRRRSGYRALPRGNSRLPI